MKRHADGTLKVGNSGQASFKTKKGEDVFFKIRPEIRITFKASNGKQTVTCVCFSKVACKMLHMEANEFIALNEFEQRNALKKVLYERKLLTLKNQQNEQWHNFLIINVEEAQEKN